LSLGRGIRLAIGHGEGGVEYNPPHDNSLPERPFLPGMQDRSVKKILSRQDRERTAR
jgi:hypothetical protein